MAALVGAGSAVAFVVVERRAAEPMLRLELFADRSFTGSNLMTFVVYAALGAVIFFVSLQLQTVSGYGALAAGLAFLPLTVCMVLFASAGGRLAQRIGPRLPMTVGPLLMAAGTLMLLGVGEDASFWVDVLPGSIVFGLGLATMVAPLTATVLAAAFDQHAGIASGVSNAVARSGTLLAIAALPLAVGLSGGDYDDAVAFDAAYSSAMVACVVLLVLGGAVSWVMIRNEVLEDGADSPESTYP